MILSQLWQDYEHGNVGGFTTRFWNILPLLHRNDHNCLRGQFLDYLDTYYQFNGKASETASIMLSGDSIGKAGSFSYMLRHGAIDVGAVMVLVWQYGRDDFGGYGIDSYEEKPSIADRLSEKWCKLAEDLCEMFMRADFSNNAKLRQCSTVFDRCHEYKTIPMAYKEICNSACDILKIDPERYSLA